MWKLTISLAAALAASTAAPALAHESGVTLLSDADMDMVVAGYTIYAGKILRTGNVLGITPVTGQTIYRTIDFSDKPDQAAALLFNGGLPDNNGTNIIDETRDSGPDYGLPSGILFVDLDGTGVGTGQDPRGGAAFEYIESYIGTPSP